VFAAQRLNVSVKLQLSLCVTLSIFVYNQSLEKRNFAVAVMVGASISLYVKSVESQDCHALKQRSY
jgi:hypothetical protein